MGDIDITIAKDGRIRVDINLPEGKECDDADATIRATLAALGVLDESVMDDLKRTPVPDGSRDRNRGGT